MRLIAALLACAVFSNAKAALADIEYRTSIEIDVGNGLPARIRVMSTLIGLEEKPPATLGVLRRRAEKDRARIEKLLRSEGYYDARVSYRIEPDGTPVRVIVSVEAGRAYRLESFEVVFDGAIENDVRARLDRVVADIQESGSGRAEDIRATEDRLVAVLTEHGYALAETVRSLVTLDRSNRTLAVTLTLRPGRLMAFGETTIEGTDHVRREYVRRRVPWVEGDRYDVRLLEVLRQRLTASGLFSMVRVRPAEAVEGQRIPVQVHVEEARARSVAAGVRYDSSTGAGGTVFWEHRNLAGGAERLRIGGDVSELGQSGRLVFRKPDLLVTGQTLLLDSAYEIADTDAFRSQTFSISGGVERTLGDRWTLRAGLSFESGPVKGFRQDRNFTLVGVPLALTRDTTNDILGPTRGSRFEATVVSYPEGVGSDISFVSGRISDSFYLPLDRRERIVVAGRLAIGSVSGAAFASVPANKRFYAGGGGSVRGYEFQHAGPLDSNGDPIGGRSIVEMSGELRLRLGERFGLVPFVDGGNVYEQVLPSFDGGLLWGAGLGLRYYSAAGPIRLDVAIPVNRRGKFDDFFQLYVSLGQAF